LVGSIGAISNYMCGTFTKSANMASGCGIDNKVMHYQNCLMWIMLPTKIHHWKMVIIISFGNSFFQRLHQIFNCLLKLKISISKAQVLGATISWYWKTSFSIGVQTWPCEGFVSVVTTNNSIKRILVSSCIFGSPLLMLILTSCYFATCRLARPSRSIMWNYPP
jgi:hypothetical protein